MKLEGGCYCGKVRYVAEGQPMLKAQCHCRECQYVSGGSPNVFMLMPPAGFSYVRGVPKQFLRQRSRQRGDTRILRRLRDASDEAPTRVARGDFEGRHHDDPSVFGNAQMAIFTVDKQPFHLIAEGVPIFERLPPRA